MTGLPITYSNILIKQLVENWGDDKGLNVNERILLHMEELHDICEIFVLDAEDQGDALLIRLSADKWSSPREFVLDKNGSLFW